MLSGKDFFFFKNRASANTIADTANLNLLFLLDG